jgi:hypothetical protein
MAPPTPPEIRLRAIRHVLRLAGVDERRNNPHARANVPGPKSKPPEPPALNDAEVDDAIDELLGKLREYA